MDSHEVDRIVTQAVKAAMSATDERFNYTHDLVEKHEHLLYGNGREGLTTIVDRLTRAVDRFEKVWLRVVEALVVAGVFGLIILLVQKGLLK